MWDKSAAKAKVVKAIVIDLGFKPGSSATYAFAT